MTINIYTEKDIVEILLQANRVTESEIVNVTTQAGTVMTSREIFLTILLMYISYCHRYIKVKKDLDNHHTLKQDNHQKNLTYAYALL